MKHLKIPFHHSLFRKVYKLYNIPSLEFFERYRIIKSSKSNRDVLIPKPIPFIKDKYIIRELLFRGYVPIKEYKPNIKYFYDYAIVNGKCYILPIRLKPGYKSKRKNIGKLPKYGQLWVDSNRYSINGYGSMTIHESQTSTLITYYNKAQTD